MSIAYFILSILVLWIEPIILWTLYWTIETTKLLTYTWITNIVIILLFGLIFQVLKKTGETQATNVENSTASFLFFPAYILLSLTISFYLTIAPTMYGIVAMFAAAILFFTVLVMGYQKIQTNGVFWGNKKIMPKDYVLWIAIVIASAIFFFLPELNQFYKITIALWSVIIVMTLIIRGMKLIKSSNIFRMISMKLFLLAAIWFTIFSGANFYAQLNDSPSMKNDLVATITEIFSGVITWENLSLTWAMWFTWEAINSNSWDALLESGVASIDDVMSWDIEALLSWLLSNVTIENDPETQVLESTGSSVAEVEETIVEQSVKQGPLTYAEVVPYVVKDNGLKLLSNTKTKFINISQSNTLYSSFNIAAQHKLIWKDINPGKQVSCDTYIVLKWLAQWRTTNNVWTIFANYRAAATAKNQLNGCEKWVLVTHSNL